MRAFGSSASFRAFVAAVTTLAPALAARADEPLATDYLTHQTVAAMTVRLADAAKQPQFMWYPIEVLDAATEDFLGLPLDTISRVTLMVEPPMGDKLRFAVVMQTSSPISFDNFRHELTKDAERGELLGRPLLSYKEQQTPCLCLFDERTLVAGPRLFLKSLLRAPGEPSPTLDAAMSSHDGHLDHIRGTLLIKPLRPLIELALQNPPADFDPRAAPFLEIPLLLDSLVLSCRYDSPRKDAITFVCRDQTAADRLEAIMADGWQLLRQVLAEDENLEELRQSEEAVAQAYFAYLDRLVEMGAEATSTLRQDETTFCLKTDHLEERYVQAYSVALVGIMVALLLPAVQAAREAARRTQSMNNMRRLALAVLNYESAHGRLPAQAICADDGTPLLSWRVTVLPYMEDQALYNQFHLDEPWDSPHNKPLLAKMPQTYIDPSSPGLSVEDGKTHYLGVTGPNAVFVPGAQGRSFRTITDGTSRTLMSVQVDDNHAVEWTKPIDYRSEAHAENPIGGIGSLHPGIFLAGRADGSVFVVELGAAPELIRGALTASGGETEDLR